MFSLAVGYEIKKTGSTELDPYCIITFKEEASLGDRIVYLFLISRVRDILYIPRLLYKSNMLPAQ